MTPAAKRYKQQAEEAERQKRNAERELNRLREAEKERLNKRWDAIVYCENCMEVTSVSVPRSEGMVSNSGCAICGSRAKQHLVRKVNCGKTQ